MAEHKILNTITVSGQTYDISAKYVPATGIDGDIIWQSVSGLVSNEYTDLSNSALITPWQTNALIDSKLDTYATMQYVDNTSALIWSNTIDYISNISHTDVPVLWQDTLNYFNNNTISSSAEMRIPTNSSKLVQNGAITGYIDSLIVDENEYITDNTPLSAIPTVGVLRKYFLQKTDIYYDNAVGIINNIIN